MLVIMIRLSAVPLSPCLPLLFLTASLLSPSAFPCSELTVLSLPTLAEYHSYSLTGLFLGCCLAADQTFNSCLPACMAVSLRIGLLVRLLVLLSMSAFRLACLFGSSTYLRDTADVLTRNTRVLITRPLQDWKGWSLLLHSLDSQQLQ